jgi:hypothetical protein
MPTHKLTVEVLNAAIEGFESQKRRIDVKIAEVRQMLDGGHAEPGATPAVPSAKRRKMSAAARKLISDAQRKRWAESRGKSASPPESITPKPKRKISAAGRKAIVAALKKRWAEKKAAAAKSEPATSKKVAANRNALKKVVAKKAAKGPQH